MSSESPKTSFEPEVVVLYCQHCVGEGAQVTLESDRASGFSVRAVMMPCSSKVEVPYVLKILERGADTVEVIACPEKACRFLFGSARTEKRIDYIRGLLEEIGIGSERVGICRGSGLSGKELVALAGTRADAVRELGPNPMKKGES